MKKALFATGIVPAVLSIGVHAHPGVHHLTGAGHSGSDTLVLVAVAAWLLLSAGLVIGLALKRRRRS